MIVFDRGLLDAKGYMDAGMWAKILEVGTQSQIDTKREDGGCDQRDPSASQPPPGFVGMT